MTTVLVLLALACLLLALGRWYDVRHRSRGEVTRVDGPRRTRLAHRTDASRWKGPDGP